MESEDQIQMPAVIDPSTTILAIVGPTAVGKTAVALEIAPALDAEIVSVDSMQVYAGMDIGTSKPSPADVESVPFHLIDLVAPDSDFSVAVFKQKADSAIAGIVAGGKQPLLVGGSGLYFRAVVDDLDFARAGARTADGGIRDDLEEMTTDELREILVEEDPEAASEILPSNRRRIMRAIEVARRGERLISEKQRSWKDYESPYNLVAAGLDMDRALLYRMIDRRVDDMMDAGLEQEVRILRDGGLKPGTTAGEALGYKQILQYLDGAMTRDQAVQEIKKRTRNYAKRQLTWFRKDPRIRWFQVEGNAQDPIERSWRSIITTAGQVLEYISKKLEN